MTATFIVGIFAVARRVAPIGKGEIADGLVVLRRQIILQHRPRVEEVGQLRLEQLVRSALRHDYICAPVDELDEVRRVGAVRLEFSPELRIGGRLVDS